LVVRGKLRYPTSGRRKWEGGGKSAVLKSLSALFLTSRGSSTATFATGSLRIEYPVNTNVVCGCNEPWALRATRERSEQERVFAKAQVVCGSAQELFVLDVSQQSVLLADTLLGTLPSTSVCSGVAEQSDVRRPCLCLSSSTLDGLPPASLFDSMTRSSFPALQVAGLPPDCIELSKTPAAGLHSMAEMEGALLGPAGVADGVRGVGSPESGGRSSQDIMPF
jgi:hypothetical protein